MAEKKDKDGDSMDSDVIVSALKFWQKVYEEKEVVIQFEKKDKTLRVMRATLDFSKIPANDHPKSVNIKQILKLIQVNKIMHVYDLDKKAWRSVPFDRVNWMDTKDRRYYTKRYRTGVTPE